MISKLRTLWRRLVVRPIPYTQETYDFYKVAREQQQPYNKLSREFSRAIDSYIDDTTTTLSMIIRSARETNNADS